MSRIICSAIILFYGCANNSNLNCTISSLNKDFPSEVKSLSSEIIYNNISLLNPRGLVIIDSIALFVDPADNISIKCYNLKSGKIFSKFLTNGRGKNEMIYTENINLYKSDSIQVSNSSRDGERKIFIYAINDILANNTAPKRIITFPTDSALIQSEIKLIDNNIFGLGCALKKENRFTIYDTGSNNCTYFGEYNNNLFKSQETLTISDKKFAWDAYDIDINEKNNLIVSATIWFGAIEIIDIDKKIISHYKYYDTPNPIIEQIGNARLCTYDKTQKHGFKNITSTNNLIYALYSNKTPMEKHSQLANTIYVYDWELKPKYKYKTDQNLKHIYLYYSG